ncbi:hypothetical protein SCAR479_11911 [Seiridium cardinale]|uniref:Uncharacterized protein n=1 Tax=Seiridium cardinale TaxID=138064 RepID=A0ABR2XCE4_9PEZI
MAGYSSIPLQHTSTGAFW